MCYRSGLKGLTYVVREITTTKHVRQCIFYIIKYYIIILLYIILKGVNFTNGSKRVKERRN